VPIENPSFLGVSYEDGPAGRLEGQVGEARVVYYSNPSGTAWQRTPDWKRTCREPMAQRVINAMLSERTVGAA
jgi:hypothetical protein